MASLWREIPFLNANAKKNVLLKDQFSKKVAFLQM